MKVGRSAVFHGCSGWRAALLIGIGVLAACGKPAEKARSVESAGFGDVMSVNDSTNDAVNQPQPQVPHRFRIRLTQRGVRHRHSGPRVANRL